MSTESEILSQLTRLSPPQRARVLEYARSLAVTKPQAMKLQAMRALARTLDFPAADLDEIQDAMEADCEKVDPDGW
jgi:hypothetical protein